MSDNLIWCKINSDVGNWHMVACYGPTTYREKYFFWEDLADKIINLQEPWLLFGDLNEITEQSEKLGGRSIHGKRLFLKLFIQEVGGADLGFANSCFTWQGNHIKEHFD